MRLRRKIGFTAEVAIVGAVVALGLAATLYALANYIGAAWHWVMG